MLDGLWGKKIGMTQIFEGNKVIPVTAIDLNHWYVTQVKTKENDGYDAVQVGHLKNRYVHQDFSSDWLKEPAKYFAAIKEIRTNQPVDQLTAGQITDGNFALAKGEVVDVWGVTKGCGFQGVVKRHGFAGGKASHGAKMGRFTGSLSFMHSQGRVIKGKKMPGHMGADNRVMKNLEIVKVDPGIMLIKGSVPGKSGGLVFIKKVGNHDIKK